METYKYTGKKLTMRNETEGLIYEGKLYKSGDYVLIKAELDELGIHDYFDYFYMCGIMGGNQARTASFLRSTGISCHYKELPELTLEEDDYEKIAYVYRRLIKNNIFIKKCKFIREGKSVHIQPPYDTVFYGETESKTESYLKYFFGDYIKKSSPEGTDIAKLNSLIWTPEEVKIFFDMTSSSSSDESGDGDEDQSEDEIDEDKSGDSDSDEGVARFNIMNVGLFNIVLIINVSIFMSTFVIAKTKKNWKLIKL